MNTHFYYYSTYNNLFIYVCSMIETATDRHIMKTNTHRRISISWRGPLQANLLVGALKTRDTKAMVKTTMLAHYSTKVICRTT